MNSLEKSLAFKTEQFDYRSDLPEEYNAGNRFYGRDVADFLTQQLAASGVKAGYLDEDWGWLVEAATPSGVDVEIAIYNINDHGNGGQPGEPEWGLWLRAFVRSKSFGIFTKRTAVAVPAEVEQTISNAIRSAGGTPVEWVDGPAS